MKARSSVKESQLSLLRYHWHSYVARGGFNIPKLAVGRLEKGGLKHWAMFLQIGKKYLADYPKDRYIIEGFVQPKIVKLLVGE